MEVVFCRFAVSEWKNQENRVSIFFILTQHIEILLYYAWLAWYNYYANFLTRNHLVGK